jgi:hypothetical protein
VPGPRIADGDRSAASVVGATLAAPETYHLLDLWTPAAWLRCSRPCRSSIVCSRFFVTDKKIPRALPTESPHPLTAGARYDVRMLRRTLAFAIGSALAAGFAVAQPRPVPQVDWTRLEQETLEHFQAILRIDTSNPPGNETAVVEYLSQVLTREGIPFQTFALDPQRANLVARITGNGSRRPLLIMGHTDVVTVDPAKWKFPPFSATRDGGYIYARGALDDKPHVVAGLMTLLTLKRLNVALDRDVIFLAEAGEESTTRFGIDFMTEQHFDAIDAEFCIAEGGGVRREGGRVKFASVGTTEKTPRTLELVARGPSSHGSMPTTGNAPAGQSGGGTH